MRAPSSAVLLSLALALPAGPLGCWSAATKTFDTGADRDLDLTDGGDDGGGGTGGDGGGGTGGDGGTGGNDGGPGGGDTGPSGDLDGDGYTVEEGDCDDQDERVHPGAIDDCDAWDEDCDEQVDEDARYDDDYEPNDAYDDAVDLGNLDDSPEQRLAGYLHNAEDVDRFVVYVEDGWFDFFTITVTLSDIPETATYRVTVLFRDPDGDVELGSAYGSDSAVVVVEEGWGETETGTYEIRIEPESDPDCGRPYQLDIVLDELF